ASTMRWIFVLNPPLLRPIAWSSPSFWAPALCWCLRPLSIECRRAADGDAPAWPPRSIFTKAISGFVRAMPYSAGPSARFNRPRLLAQLSGRNSRNASMTGAYLALAVRNLAQRRSILGSDPHRCMPFLGIAVSSITGTASLPPTNEPPIVGLQCDFCFGSPEIVDWATPRFLTFKQEIEAG